MADELTRSGPIVTLNTPTYRVVRRHKAPRTAQRIKAWIIRVIMLATGTFALVDLYLLISGGHH